MVNAYSKWPEILPMSSTTAVGTIAAFRNVFARFGFPVNVVTGNGPQFISAEFGEFLRQNGVKHIQVTLYHLASNGAEERMVQSFKRSVEASVSTGAPTMHRLAAFLLTYRTTPHAVTGRTPSSLFLGRECRTRLSLLRPTVEESVLSAGRGSSQKIGTVCRMLRRGDGQRARCSRGSLADWYNCGASRTQVLCRLFC